MTERCESRFGGHRCDKQAGHTGPHFAEYVAVAGDAGNTAGYGGIAWGNLDADGRPND